MTNPFEPEGCGYIRFIKQETSFEFLEVLKKCLSVEKLKFFKETKAIIWSMFRKISILFDDLPAEINSNIELEKRGENAKAIICTDDFKILTNLLLTYGAGNKTNI